MSRKILVVDDSIMDRNLLCKVLECDYEVLQAQNGVQALEILTAQHTGISAVLLDLIMPVMDGYEILERVRNTPELSDIPVVVLTSNSDSETEIRALSLGAMDFLTKPYNPGVILRRLKNIINLRETTEKLRLSEQEIKLALSRMGKLIFIYDIPTRTLSMPESYAKKMKMPSVLAGVPQSILKRGIISPRDRDVYLEFYEALLRGEKDCVAKVHKNNPDGSWSWERAESVTFFGSDGTPLKAVISVEVLSDDVSAEASEILSQVCLSLYGMYLLDYELDECVPIKHIAQDKELHRGLTLCWSRSLESILEKSVAPEYRTNLRCILHRDLLRSSFKNLNERIEEIYQQMGGGWKKLVLQPLVIRDGVTSRALITIIDVTEMKRQIDKIAADKAVTSQRAQEYAGLFFNAAAKMYVNILKVNLNTGRVSRISFEDGSPLERDIGRSWGAYFQYLVEMAHPSDRELILEKLQHVKLKELSEKSCISFTYRSRIKGRGYCWYTTTLHGQPDINKNSVVGGQPEPDHVFTVFTLDVNDVMVERAYLKNLSEHDSLTDLFNRTKYEFMRETEYRRLSSCGVMFLDVNDLKMTNDVLGHEAGNALLTLVADSVRSITSRRVQGYRYGGDEFVVIACNAKKEELQELLSLWSHRLRELSQAREIPCTVAVGVAWSAAPFSIDDLLSVADKEMYENKLEIKRKNN